MPTPKMTAQRVLDFFECAHATGWPENGMSLREVAAAVEVPQSTFERYLYRFAPEFGIEPYRRLAPKAAAKPAVDPVARVRQLVRRAPMTLEQIAAAVGTTTGGALDALEALKREGINVQREGEYFAIRAELAPAASSGVPRRVLVSDKDNRYRFGVVADSHLGSKYERLDCLHDTYDRFARAGISHVMHCGNWIEGEARFNRTDVHTHGMDAQLRYLAEHYPHRPGIQTWAVAGDDHEGWYAQREALNIGQKAEDMMRRAGRTDWHDLGYIEAFVELRNGNTGKSAILAVVHPGGGSSYAESYVVQKLIESYDGGEKPAVALYGHYHKCGSGMYRNVWWVLVPSTKDQDVFMHKKRLSSVVGGGIIGLEQDPDTGAIVGMTPELWRYFNRGYYNGRWSHSGDVVLPERRVA